MSLTRKMLKAMSIEEDAIEQIIEAHTETIESIKAERDQLKEEAQQAEEVEQGLRDELEQARKQLEDHKGDSSKYDRLKAKYDTEHAELEELRKTSGELRSEYDTYRNGVEERETERKKAKAYKDVLAKAGIAQKYVGAVLRVAKLSDVELNEDGSLKGAEDIEKQVREEYPEFVAKIETKGAAPDNPPATVNTPEGAHERAIQIAKERHERLYGKKSEE